MFQPEDGTLELFARGGRAVHEPLQAAFCQAVLDVKAEPANPLRPAFTLDHLLDPNFPLVTDPGDRVAEAKIVRLRLEPKTAPGSHIELKADPKGDPGEIIQMLDHYCQSGHVSPARVHVRQAGFRINLFDGVGTRASQSSATKWRGSR